MMINIYRFVNKITLYVTDCLIFYINNFSQKKKKNICEFEKNAEIYFSLIK